MTGPTTIGTLAAIWRYPVKSMAGERLSSTDVTLQGIAADRRYAYVQTASRSPFPWLTGREMPAMLRYQPQWRDGSGDPSLWVCTPSGESLEIGSDALRDEHLLQRGVFSEVQDAAGSFTGVNPPWQMSGTGTQVRGWVPGVGEHTADVLRDVLQLDAAAVRRLSDAGVFGVR